MLSRSDNIPFTRIVVKGKISLGVFFVIFGIIQCIFEKKNAFLLTVSRKLTLTALVNSHAVTHY